MAIKKITELGFKGLTEILEQLSKKGVKSKTPSVRARRRSLKGTRKFEPIAGAGSRQPGRKIGEGVPTAGKGRATVKASSPPIKATRPTLKAKPKVSRTTGRKKSTAVVPTPSTAVTKKPSTALVPITGSRAVTGGGTKAGSTMKPATRTPQARIASPKRSKVTPPVGTASKLKKGPAIAAGLLTAGALTGAMLNKKDKAQAAPKSMPLPKSKPTPPSKPKVMPKSSGPSTRGSAKKGATKRISAGPNTGFGPKGNIFPGSSAERAALMKMYGGTGSAAGKAAAAGKQGNMEAGRKELMAAKKKRLSKPAERKSGGKVGIKQIKTKGSVAMEQVPAKKSYNPSARQVKGFGKARRPKK